MFQEHFCSDDYNDVQDWVINLIEHLDDKTFLRQGQLFWGI